MSDEAEEAAAETTEPLADGKSDAAGDNCGVPVVGIGASAGGIEALSQFFDGMAGDSGLAFVVVLHLDPTRESQLSAILSHHTSMPVVEIEDGLEVTPNHVYVIAPNHDLTLDGNVLRLTEPEQPRGHRHPVDVLFKSLAEQRAERTAAVILSGTGTNGTQGLKEIKAGGGLILVQDPATARFDGMPRSAIGAGLADHVLAPADMPATLLQYFQHGYVAAPDGLAVVRGDKQPRLERLFGLLRAHSGFDFHIYKSATLLRRINRRMSLMGVGNLEDYIDRLRPDLGEVKALVRDLLISVTSFFRDADAWRTLDDIVISQMVADRETGASIRVWVPGCSTGEEAYSVAMLLQERAEAAHKQFDLKIFASDIQDDNLNAARAGVYPGSSVESLPTERIMRFFERLDGSYQVRKSLRDLVVFARQNLFHDPPFSRMDLITCRNMLIYVEPEGQKRALTLFHFSLREGGRLFLGSAETIGRADDLFETLSKKWRIYRRFGPTRHDIVDFPVLGGRATRSPQSGAGPMPEPSMRVSDAARRALLDRYAPASVLIDRRGRVLYFHGDTGDYLKQPNGEPTRDLLAMAREGLLSKLRVAINRVIADEQESRFIAQIRQGDLLRSVAVTLSPLPTVPPASGMTLVTFEPVASESPAVLPTAKSNAEDEVASALENELRSARAELQGSIEQLESVNEELKASNEEATSMNEELQSTNEELETSKEELQSFNEELHSVNSQLQHKINELDQTGNDLANLLSGTEIATVFQDTELRVKWFSPATKPLLNLVLSDVGRPIAHFARQFIDDKLLGDAETVLAKLTPIEAEIRGDDGKWFIRRLLPYRTRDNRIAGLVITFVDITDRRRATDGIDEARIYAEAIVATARQPLVVLDAALRMRSANRAFYTLLDTTPDKAEHRRLYELGNGEWNVPEFRRLLDEVLPKDERFDDVEVTFGPAGRDQRTMLVNARTLARNGGREQLILLAIEEITQRKRDAGHQEMLIGELNHRVKNVLATVQAIMSQTSRQSISLDDFRVAFEGRLHALAQAHDLLTEKGWVGTEIGQIVTQTLAPYRLQDSARIAVEGPLLTVRSQSGVALLMVLHELATNAAKYGALSAPAGKLSVTWRRISDGASERIQLQWTETDGPKVTPPTRQGFGTKLIERSTMHELGGEARLAYLEEGLRCELIFPWAGLPIQGSEIG
ncbi:chemotaxis protein CheB [Acidisphaera sp. S103]|uniref:chemotaxis protein CheB n=1 Tax=Acidisphaera sp. S103 TaxID=1747223 RepID=UPI00131BD7F3|nr:chemotaxis protein CheB [Acidisphaera sp. S103]